MTCQAYVNRLTGAGCEHMVFVSGAVRPGEQEQAMKATITESFYLRCPPCFEPSGLRFDVPGWYQGRTIEHARGPLGEGAP